MIKFKKILRELGKKRPRWPELEKLVGSYTLQGHISSDKNIQLKNRSPEFADVDPAPYGYPPPFGFWTSTVHKDIKEFDKDYFVTNWRKISFTNPKGSYFHIFTIRGDPNIKHLRTEKEANNFIEKYIDGIKDVDWDDDNFEPIVLWDKISEEYDAVHCWDGAFRNKVFENWDVESTVWFRPKDYLKEQFVWKIKFEK